MQIFIKPSGAEVAVNETSAAHARALGWIPKDEVERPKLEVKEPKPRGRPRLIHGNS